MTTAFYTPTFGPTGFVAPATEDVLAGVQADINSAFGGTLNQALNTPQGQLATTLAAIIDDKNATFLFYASQTDPQYAMGRMQDAIGQIYFMTRIPAQPTSVLCVCTGIPGTAIPVNAQAQDTSGNIYICVAGGSIPVSGSVSLLFVNINSGPIPCLAGTVTQIYTSVPGWSGITNPGGTDTDPTTLGRSVENQQEFEYRRQQSVALNSVGMVQSIYALVSASETPNPVDVYVTENVASTPQTIGGVLLAANSIYVAVVGGNPQAIATAIWKKKSPGCNYNGSTSQVVYDYNYAPPVPYTVYYQVPVNLGIYFTVNMVNNGNLPADIVAQTKAAIASAFTGGDGGDAQRIGGTVYASRFYLPVIKLSPYVQIDSIYVDTTAAPAAGTSVTVNIDEFPITQESNVTVNLV
jgi:hypothetical protein